MKRSAASGEAAAEEAGPCVDAQRAISKAKVSEVQSFAGNYPAIRLDFASAAAPTSSVTAPSLLTPGHAPPVGACTPATVPRMPADAVSSEEPSFPPFNKFV